MISLIPKNTGLGKDMTAAVIGCSVPAEQFVQLPVSKSPVNSSVKHFSLHPNAYYVKCERMDLSWSFVSPHWLVGALPTVGPL